jgi:XRN 5'-3' exonuclease N-terminus
MGIQGAMSLFEEDPRRFGRPWRCNWLKEEKGHNVEEKDRKKADNAEEMPFVLLVDGMALLYHVTVNRGLSIDMSPSTIRDKVAEFVSHLLAAIPPSSQIRIFMDGLAPKAKLSTQIDRLRSQAISGENLAEKLTKNNIKGKKYTKAKLLHLLAEWAMVEAIEDLSTAAISTQDGKTLELHRPSRGEAEAYIDYWIEKRVKPNTKVYILADDTDFLVYPCCPGFISFKSLEIQLDNGITRLSGIEYTKQQFLDAFLPNAEIFQEDAMPVVAALAGCDYLVDNESQRVLSKATNLIVKSDVGGLRQKARNNPSKAQRLTAILRFVAHYVDKDRENWVESICKAATTFSKKKISKRNGKENLMTQDMDIEEDPSDADAANLKEAFRCVRKTYFHSLALPNSAFEKKPSSVEIRRLLEYGVFFCRPIIESWQSGSSQAATSTSRKRGIWDVQATMKDNIEDYNNHSSAMPIVISPPFTRQIKSWIEQHSIWRMPHFCQARLRLYCLLVQFARKGGAYSFEGGQLRLSPMWTNENPKVTEYVRSFGGKDANGESALRMLKNDVEIVNFEFVSTGWGDEGDLLSGEFAVDRACLFCILGNVKQANSALNPCLRGLGIVFLTSLFLPYNLALLFILLGTSPALESVIVETVEDVPRKETNRVLPFISVACYHSMFISNTILSLFGTDSEEQKMSNLARSSFRVSDVLCRENAMWIWNAIRRGADLEQMQSDDSDDSKEMKFAMQYLDEALDRLASQVPETTEWDEKMLTWKSQAKVLWVLWWDVFNVALNTADSAMEMNEP